VTTLQLILYIVAAVLLVLAGFNVGHPRISLAWLGMALWLIAYALVPHLA